MSEMDHIEGLFVGQLSDDELEMFKRAVADGVARWSYEGGAGLLGLAKVRLMPSAKRDSQ